MMKKLLLLSSAFFAFQFGTYAQQQVASTPTVVTDTLRYFENKELFKIGHALATYTNYGYLRVPTGAATNSYTYTTHYGSIFHNSDTNLIINGLEGWATKHNKSNNQRVAVHIYLYNVVNGLPVEPPVDSIAGFVDNTCAPVTNYCPPVLVAGNFTTGPTANPVLNPRRIKGDFAVMMRNFSTYSGDTVRFFRTSTLTHNNPFVSGPYAPYYQTGENMGVVKKAGQFILTANYTGREGFGIGTDYEFLVAPRVQFTLTVDQKIPQNATGDACMFDQLTFTNTSSPELNNRQFNLNAFYRENKPFLTEPVSFFYPDTVLRWNFDDDPRLDTVPYLWGRVQDLFLGVNQNTVSKWFDTSGVFLHGYQKGIYRKMTTCYSTRLVGMSSFSMSVIPCGPDGIRDNGALANVSVYPNPAVNGVVNVAGLTGKNTVTTYNMLGQPVSIVVTDKSNAVVDLEKYPSGTYMIRIVNSDNRSKVVKVIHNN